ncbi:MAG: class I SAM-dependent methyltransferase [Actinomycetota bacterium]
MAEPTARAPWSTDAWRDEAGRSWLEQAGWLEAMLEPVLDPLLERAVLTSGEDVLDVGCGRGATTLRAVGILGATGSVTAVDVSADLIDEARRLIEARDGSDDAAIDWMVADAQRASFTPGRFDAAISRFGVMFFDEPVEAFANIRSAVRPGGRLAIATWQPRNACDFQALGWDAIAAKLRANGYTVQDPDPTSGPYAFGLESFVRSVLHDADWTDISIEPVGLPLYYGGPGVSTEQAVASAMGMTGLKRFLDAYDARAAELAAEAMLEAFGPHHDGTGVRLDAAILVTTALAGD